MSSLQKNVAGQSILFQLNSRLDGTVVTSGANGNYVLDSGSQTACAGTFTHKGNGQWEYAPLQAETNGVENVCFQFFGTNSVVICQNFYLVGYNPATLVFPSNFGILSISASGYVTITSNIKKNTAVPGFMFIMTDSTTHAPKTGLGSTIASLLYQDGVAVGGTANTASEISNGWYTINLASSDTNANKVGLNFQAAGADALNIELITQP